MAMKEALMYLQQQKLLELTSHRHYLLISLSIYNSRNYQSLLASNNYNGFPFNLQQQKLLELTSPYQISGCTRISTIVEIIRAYQPLQYRSICRHNLQQQKLLELTSPKVAVMVTSTIYNSRNYQSLLAPCRLQRYKKSFKQKHFLYLF